MVQLRCAQVVKTIDQHERYEYFGRKEEHTVLGASLSVIGDLGYRYSSSRSLLMKRSHGPELSGAGSA